MNMTDKTYRERLSDSHVAGVAFNLASEADAEIAALRSAAQTALEDLEKATSFISKKSRDRHACTVAVLRAALNSKKESE